MCTAGGEVVSVRCCSGGLNYYPHRLHLTLPVSFVIHIQSFVHHPPPLHTQTAHETEMKGGGAVQVVCANVGAVGWWRMDSSCHYHNGRVDVTNMT